MGLLDLIRALLPGESGETTGVFDRLAGGVPLDRLPIRGGVFLDGLFWVGTLEASAGEGDGPTDLNLEGPRCPDCNPDIRWRSVRVVDAAPPVDGEG